MVEKQSRVVLTDSQQRFRLLVESLQQIAGSETRDGVMEIVRGSLRRLTGADGVTLVLRDGEHCHYVWEDAPVGPLWQGQRFPLISCVSGWAMLNQQTAVIDDVLMDERVPRDAYEPTWVRSLIMVPLGGRESSAALGAYWSDVRQPEEEEVLVLEALARAAGVALDRVDTAVRLQESEEKYRTLFDSMDEGYLLGEVLFENDEPVDVLYLDANPAAIRITGIDYRGRRLIEINSGFESYWIELFGRVVRTGRSEREMWYASPLKAWYDFMVFRVGEEDSRKIAIVFEDATERKKAEEELHVAVQRFETLANVMPQIVWSTRPDGYHDYFNERWYEYTGMPRGEGQGWNWKDYLHPDDVPRTMVIWHHSLATGEPYEVQYRFRRAHDGAYRWFIGRALPIRDIDGAITRWFGTCTDIEDQHREEEHLELLVAERTTRLQQQKKQLRVLASRVATAEQRERKRMAALLHDGLQQLLVAAKIELQRTDGLIDDPSVEECLIRATRHVQEAIQAARDLTHQLRPPVLYEDGLVPALNWLASSMLARYRIDVTLDVATTGRRLNDDVKALLFESVSELLFNIVKHAGIDTATVRLREKGDVLRLVVQDAGRGFDMQELVKDHESTGFGLFRMRERITAAGGALMIETRPGMGTRIEIVMPIVAAEAAKVASMPPEQHMPSVTDGRRISVLVVEDHALVREGITKILGQEERLQVVGQAPDGVEAIEAVSRYHPDVVLMDVNMPRMNGIEATREISRRWPGTLIIGLSVQDDDATARSMMDAGAAAFMAKAGDSNHMIETIIRCSKAAEQERVFGLS